MRQIFTKVHVSSQPKAYDKWSRAGRCQWRTPNTITTRETQMCSSHYRNLLYIPRDVLSQTHRVPHGCNRCHRLPQRSSPFHSLRFLFDGKKGKCSLLRDDMFIAARRHNRNIKNSTYARNTFFVAKIYVVFYAPLRYSPYPYIQPGMWTIHHHTSRATFPFTREKLEKRNLRKPHAVPSFYKNQPKSSLTRGRFLSEEYTNRYAI